MESQAAKSGFMGRVQSFSHICSREKTGKAKAQFELTLATVVLDNKKGFFKYANSKRGFKHTAGLIADENGCLTSMDEEEAEAFSDIFTSIFSINDISWAACDWGEQWQCFCGL